MNPPPEIPGDKGQEPSFVVDGVLNLTIRFDRVPKSGALIWFLTSADSISFAARHLSRLAQGR